jgi:thiosulfate dehydrogenase (quinone) large subunit
MNRVLTRTGRLVEDPPLARFLFSDTRAAVIWLAVRIALGMVWLDAAFRKLGNADWMETGDALRAFWQQAVEVPPAGSPQISYDWYRNFIQSLLDVQVYTWFAKLIAYSELLIAVALMLGTFVGIAAFLGAFLNWNFIMVGSAGTNGLLGAAAVLLVLAWKIAGYYGLDFYLLNWLGTPWRGHLPDADSGGEPAYKAG